MSRLLILLTICVGLTAISFLLPWFLGRDTPPTPKLSGAHGAKYVSAIAEGRHYERNGDLNAARKRYEFALDASMLAIRHDAATSIVRIDEKKSFRFGIWQDLDTARRGLILMRVPAMLIALLVLAAVFARWCSGHRSQCAVGEFPVLGVDGSSSLDFRRVLVGRLENIRSVYERPGDILENIGGGVQVSSFLPESAPEDIVRQTAEELPTALDRPKAYVLEKAAKWFVLDWRRCRFRIEGCVEILGDRSRAWAKIDDTKERKTLARVKASSGEFYDLEADTNSRQNLLASARIAYDRSRPDVSCLLAAVATVLAYKIWHERAKTATSGFEIRTWKTPYLFCETLSSMQTHMPSDAAPQSHLRNTDLLSEILVHHDPMYAPARFVLGYAHLTNGDCEASIDEFQKLMANVDWEASEFVSNLEQQLDDTPFRSWLLRLLVTLSWFLQKFGAPGKKLAERCHGPLIAWYNQYRHIVNSHCGGSMYRLSKAWSNFESEFKKWQKAKEENDEMGKLFFHTYVNGFGENTEWCKYVKIAAELEDSEEISSKEAKRLLNEVLGEERIRFFKGKMQRLSCGTLTNQLCQLSGKTRDLEKQIESQLTDFNELTKKASALERQQLKEIRALWDKRKWKECRKYLDKFAEEFREPDPQDVGKLIAQSHLSEHGKWLVLWLSPLAARLRQWRQSFASDRLYIESRFYANFARFRTADPEQMKKAMEDSSRMHTYLLDDPDVLTNPRNRELKKMAICLDVEARVRFLLDHRDRDEDTRSSIESHLSEFVSSRLDRLIDFSGDPSPEVRSAAFRCLALLKRLKRISQESYWIDPSDNLKNRVSQDEQSLLHSSLRARVTPEGYTYLAECLKGLDETEYARHYIDHALRICPNHPLAKKAIGVV